jgi:integrase
VANSAKLWITAGDLKAQPPGAFILWDSEVTGFMARRQKSDLITFSVFYRTKEGVQRLYKIGHFGTWTPVKARDRARQIRLAADEDQADPARERYDARNSPAVAELLDLYVADMQSAKHNGKKASTIKTDLSRIERHIKPKLGNLKVAAVSRGQIEVFMNAATPGSARRLVALVSAIFSFAVKRGMRPDNPCRGVEKPQDRRKERRLSAEEYQHLSKAISGASNATAAAIIKFLTLTGFRSGEACLLKWAELDLPRQTAILADTKSGKSIRPLSSAAIALIEAQPRNGSEYVFPYKGKPLKNLNHYFTRFGLDKTISPHVLRHSFASIAGDMRLADSTIAQLLGHRLSSITSRYIHMDKSVIEASNLVATETLRLMNGSEHRN